MFNQNSYKSLLAQMESGNDYTIINPIGALGKYQFMPSTLNSLKNIYQLPAWNNAAYFVSNPNLQETYEDALIKDSLNYLENNNLNKFKGFPVSGSIRFKNINSRISTAGLLAAIHLSGGGNLIKFFQNGYNPNDGETSLSDYLAYFSEKLPDSNIFLPLALAFIPAIVLYLT